jgi:HEAT repeat protein
VGDRTLAVYVRRALASHRPARVRGAAALALGALGDRCALPALAAALADTSSQVRLAALRSLGRLGERAAAAEALAHARVERDVHVRAVALEVAGDAGEAVERARGAAVLEVRVAGPGDDPAARPLVDVRLDDGRWLRQRALPGGELIVADLPPGAADVRRVE